MIRRVPRQAERSARFRPKRHHKWLDVLSTEIASFLQHEFRLLLEESARHRGVSMNAEIVRRLERSFERRDHAINGVAIGAELYSVLRELASFQRRINTVLSSSQDALIGPALREEVISAALGLSSSQDRIVNVLQALLPADKGLEITHRADDDIRIVTRTIQDDDK